MLQIPESMWFRQLALALALVLALALAGWRRGRLLAGWRRWLKMIYINIGKKAKSTNKNAIHTSKHVLFTKIFNFFIKLI